MMNYIKYLLILLFLSLVLPQAQAQLLEIKTPENTFSLPYWPATKGHYGAVLMVNGGQTQWSELLAYFATTLSKNGWSVVLLNCTKDKDLPWAQQLPDVIRVLRQNHNERIVLVHYGDQLNQSLNYFNQPQAKMINGLVLISAYDTQNEEQTSWALRFPVFDIVGQFDYDEVLRQTILRKKEFPQHHYLAARMPGANHDYEYNQRLLLAFMQGWMAKLPEFKPEPPPILVSYIEPVYPSESYISAIGEYFGVFYMNPSSRTS